MGVHERGSQAGVARLRGLRLRRPPLQLVLDPARAYRDDGISYEGQGRFRP